MARLFIYLYLLPLLLLFPLYFVFFVQLFYRHRLGRRQLSADLIRVGSDHVTFLATCVVVVAVAALADTRPYTLSL